MNEKNLEKYWIKMEQELKVWRAIRWIDSFNKMVYPFWTRPTTVTEEKKNA